MTPLPEQRIHPRPPGRGPAGMITFLFVEYFDELVFTIVGVAMPFLRDDLGLDYAQIGLLFGAPAILSTVLEPAVLLIGDTPLRARLILAGGLLLGMAFLLIGGAATFPLLLLALTVSDPASGAFVGLTQATMIERHPARESEMMARWTAAGTLGSLSGPALFAGLVAIGLSWRAPFVLLGAVCLGLALVVRRPQPFRPTPLNWRSISEELRSNLQATIHLRRLSRRLAGQDVRRLIRWTSAATLVLFPLWLAAPGGAAGRLAGLFVLGLLASPWYPLLQGEAFASFPGRAATVTALTSVAGTAGGFLAILAGMVAASFGLTAGLALLLLGPLGLLVFTPEGSAQGAA